MELSKHCGRYFLESVFRKFNIQESYKKEFENFIPKIYYRNI